VVRNYHLNLRLSKTGYSRVLGPLDRLHHDKALRRRAHLTEKIWRPCPKRTWCNQNYTRKNVRNEVERTTLSQKFGKLMMSPEARSGLL
jgi:hypothetical protein